MRKTNSLLVVLIAIAGCFALAACAPAGGALSEQHFAAGAGAPRRIPATAALVQGPDTTFVVQNCGSPGYTCPNGAGARAYGQRQVYARGEL